MYIAFSALQPQTMAGRNQNENLSNSEPVLRYKAYVATCEKYKDEIAAIQKYIPGWMPSFSR